MMMKPFCIHCLVDKPRKHMFSQTVCKECQREKVKAYSKRHPRQYDPIIASEDREELHQAFLEEIASTPEVDRRYVCEDYLDRLGNAMTREIEEILVRYLEPDLL